MRFRRSGFVAGRKRGEDMSKTVFGPLPSMQKSIRPQWARWLHLVLFAVGLAGWITFMLACAGGPSWSPDSSKVLFAWRDFDGGRYGVSVYDRRTRELRTIFQHFSPKQEGDTDFNVIPAWNQDGERAIVAMTTGESGDQCTLLSIAVEGSAPPEVYSLGKKAACWASTLMPQIGSRVYIGGEDRITWLDLSTGESGHEAVEGGAGFLGEHNGELVYAREASRPLDGSNDDDARDTGLEFGRVELDSLELRSAFTLWENDMPGVNLDEMSFGAWEPGGSRIAMVGPGEQTDTILILDENNGLSGTLRPTLSGVTNYRLGNLLWSPDRTTLFAPAVTKGQVANMYDYFLAEIPVTGAPGRLTRIASFHARKTGGNVQNSADLLNVEHGDMALGMSISLSPDGSMISATPANVDQDSFDAPDRALFLVDMGRIPRRVTLIPFPTAANASRHAARTAQ
jgi:hypothetical protein